MSGARRLRPLTRALWAWGLMACSDPPSKGSSELGLPKLNRLREQSAEGGAGQTAEHPLARELHYRDADFIESEHNRDPFRSYLVGSATVESAPVSQRRVIMPDTAVDAMRLIAIVSGTPRPRAMIVDNSAVGHVVERGMYVGRPQVVQAAGNVPMSLNWRVDRIRENEVVLSRQDPTAPERPPLLRLMPLHEELAQR